MTDTFEFDAMSNTTSRKTPRLPFTARPARIFKATRFSALTALFITTLFLGTSSATGVGNGRIAFADVDNAGIPQIFLINPDGSDRVQLTTVGENIYPDWSWDGTQIVFASKRTGTFEIWTMDQDGTSQTQLTFNTPGANFVPAWSPDTTKIAYASLLNAVGIPEVWTMNSDGSNQQRLTITPLIPGGVTWSLLPSWSPDGAQIAYASTFSGSSQIWKMNADGTGKTQMTNGNGPDYPDSNAPVWSRDGSSIAFWSGFETQFGEIWVMDADGSNKTKITETVDPFNSDNPGWAPDGSMLLFDTNREGPGILGIWMMGNTGANPTRLTPFTAGVPAGRAKWQPILSCCNLPGDFNRDGRFNIADITAAITRIFSGGQAPTCQDEADANGDNALNIADVTFGIARIFAAGPEPVCGTTGA